MAYKDKEKRKACQRKCDKKRNQTPKRKVWRRAYMKTYMKEYSQRDYVKAKDKARKQTLEFKTKRGIRGESRYKYPTLITCAKCGATTTLERHHLDYNDIFFIPLCAQRHYQLHIELKAMEAITSV